MSTATWQLLYIPTFDVSSCLPLRMLKGLSDRASRLAGTTISLLKNQ
ncbi:hypothetical protein [Nostoc sp. NOS(2021)]|nr:hypothetical protein [Nostoc sp. NOS(2021)]